MVPHFEFGQTVDPGQRTDEVEIQRSSQGANACHRHSQSCECDLFCCCCLGWVVGVIFLFGNRFVTLQFPKWNQLEMFVLYSLKFLRQNNVHKYNVCAQVGARYSTLVLSFERCASYNSHNLN